MNTEHTAGEWKAIVQSNKVCLIKSGDIEIARINPHFEESIHNAELIARAPELLSRVSELETQLISKGNEVILQKGRIEYLEKANAELVEALEGFINIIESGDNVTLRNSKFLNAKAAIQKAKAQ